MLLRVNLDFPLPTSHSHSFQLPPIRPASTEANAILVAMPRKMQVSDFQEDKVSLDKGAKSSNPNCLKLIQTGEQMAKKLLGDDGFLALLATDQ